MSDGGAEYPQRTESVNHPLLAGIVSHNSPPLSIQHCLSTESPRPTAVSIVSSGDPTRLNMSTSYSTELVTMERITSG